MAMRVTQQLIYGNVISQNNAALSRLMETNNQASTQKRINAPSDDPNGAVTVLNTRADIDQLGQYKRNITTANGWLNQADSTLTSVSTLITTIKGYAEQGATGTITDENRGEIASAVRQYFQQLISQANTTYSGNSLFAGQKTDTEAFTEGLGMTSNDTAFDTALAAWPNPGYTVEGDTDSTVLVQFTDTTASPPAFEYTADGGQTWTAGTYSATPAAGTQTLQMGGVNLTMSDGALAAAKASANHEDSSGTWLWIRPAAYYQGNTKEDIAVTSANNAVVASAEGTFSGNVMVRVDDTTSGPTYSYSYSTDGGTSWMTGNKSGLPGPPTSLSVPGGVLTLSGTPADGDQFFIQPSTTDISLAISPTDSVVVNGVGKDIFGGIYEKTVANPTPPPANVKLNQAATFNGSDAANLFETVGKLVGYLETNNQAGCQEALDNLTASQQQILTTAASVGAKENRVTSAGTMVDTLAENSTTTLSKVEDADLTTLITKLSEQELAYQAVLKSSSMVMNLSLVSYI
ncbi:flagellar hook-associated protein 3 [Solidesulfovibrio carbinoliphilus subsp. oakridgensis]|uniref:Flagellar hook-associated protein 3 n=1 Tax=Solidesulfovibrio carbinoliphilus subsp. oakridgensis TaxID=694327 RepID=G7QCP5_9BACT|nr:flagellar hook-associated protein FlgL [Solidesulfovibrio carbinoliphilus]EHJ46201.1 flagellar hook-associated protein 3 [Solidesulfovibrio carbinoliphilus subsp. oakridgensis]